ncbi:MAG: hypothetical protein V1663_00100 [archaeon]
MKRGFILLTILLLVGMIFISGCTKTGPIANPVGPKVSLTGDCQKVWFDENGLISRADPYSPQTDTCLGNSNSYRNYYGSKMVGACFNLNNCESHQWIGECKTKEELINICGLGPAQGNN